MVIKVTTKYEEVKYYAGKDKKGKFLFSYERSGAKEYRTGAKGILNKILYQLEQQGMKWEYEE